jgi:hypothetical protein
MHQQLWGYKVEWKSVSRGTGGKKVEYHWSSVPTGHSTPAVCWAQPSEYGYCSSVQSHRQVSLNLLHLLPLLSDAQNATDSLSLDENLGLSLCLSLFLSENTL